MTAMTKYNSKGDIAFEISNGKGYIKEYDYDGILIFEGNYLDGKKKGKGKEKMEKGKEKMKASNPLIKKQVMKM